MLLLIIKVALLFLQHRVTTKVSLAFWVTVYCGTLLTSLKTPTRPRPFPFVATYEVYLIYDQSQNHKSVWDIQRCDQSNKLFGPPPILTL